MRELWNHACANAQESAEHDTVCGSAAVVATRPPGRSTETVTTLAVLDLAGGRVRPAGQPGPKRGRN